MVLKKLLNVSEWHHAVPKSAYFKVPETLKTFRMHSTSRYAAWAMCHPTNAIIGAFAILFSKYYNHFFVTCPSLPFQSFSATLFSIISDFIDSLIRPLGLRGLLWCLLVAVACRTFFIVNTAFNMTSSGDFYSSFHNVLNPTVTVSGKIGLEYVDSSGKLSDLC